MSDPTIDEQRADFEDEAISNPAFLGKHADFDEHSEDDLGCWSDRHDASPAVGHEYPCTGCGALLFGTGGVEMCNRCERNW